MLKTLEHRTKRGWTCTGEDLRAPAGVVPLTNTRLSDGMVPRARTPDLGRSGKKDPLKRLMEVTRIGRDESAEKDAGGGGERRRVGGGGGSGGRGEGGGGGNGCGSWRWAQSNVWERGMGRALIRWG